LNNGRVNVLERATVFKWRVFLSISIKIFWNFGSFSLNNWFTKNNIIVVCHHVFVHDGWCCCYGWRWCCCLLSISSSIMSFLSYQFVSHHPTSSTSTIVSLLLSRRHVDRKRRWVIVALNGITIWLWIDAWRPPSWMGEWQAM
jgi:hypothetical protein